MEFTTLLAILGLSGAPASDKLFTTGMTLQEVLATPPAVVAPATTEAPRDPFQSAAAPAAPAAPALELVEAPEPLPEGEVLSFAQSAHQDLDPILVPYRGRTIDIAEIMEREAQKNDIDPLLLKAIIRQESGFQVDVSSHVGASGLMQLMPETAAELGCDDVTDPYQNVEAGAKYITQWYRHYGSLDLALAAYNAGPGNVDEYGGIPPFEETQNYVYNIGGEYRAMREAL